MPKFDNKDRKDPKTIDVEQVVKYLNHTFSRAIEQAFGRTKAVRTTRLGEPLVGTPLYHTQINYCYLIDDIQRGPTYMLPKAISAANEFIAAIINKESAQENT